MSPIDSGAIPSPTAQTSCPEKPKSLLDGVDENLCVDAGGVKICVGPGSIRNVAATLAEKLALDAAMAGAGERIMQGLINDAKYPGDVWAKMQLVHFDYQTGKNIVIHYWENLQTGIREGFKFK